MNVEVSPEDFVQAQRMLRIETSLGEDVMLCEHLRIEEAIGGLFEIEATVRSKRVDLKAEDLVGSLVDVSVETREARRRTWNGLCTELVEGPLITRAMRSYRLVIRPEAWLLTQKTDCRIWMDMTSVDIAKALLSEHGLPAPETKGVVEPPEPHHYSVQYNETDWAFVVRRLEEDGIFHWFDHKDGSPGGVSGSHTMMLASDASGYTDGPEPEIRYSPGSSDSHHIAKIERRLAFVPGRRAGADWNFKTPGQAPQAETPGLVKLPRNDAAEIYEYPALDGYGPGTNASDRIDPGKVEGRARLRMMAHEADHEKVTGEGWSRTMAPGRRFKPFSVAENGETFEELVTAGIVHEARDPSYETGGSTEQFCRNSFVAMPARVPATPHRTMPRPRIDGQQIAIVAGPRGEEIHPDGYGRIKVWFPWDRRAKKDGTDTCWIRVAQSWAGPTWGGQVIPRIGMEVMISYLEGNPDFPVVTGVVPNEEQKVPYELPANKTRAVFRSDSHKKDGFNEMTFEDKTGAENMFFHAQKDQTTRVLHDRTARVDRHDVHSVGGNRAVEVANHQKHEVGGSVNITVGGTGPMAVAMLAGVAGLAGQTSGLLQQGASLAGGGAATLGAFAGTLASSALGFLSGAGLGAREGVVSGPSPRSDAGVGLAASGTGVGEDSGSLFPISGILNTVIGSFQSTSVGIASVEQIGLTRVANVGATDMVTIGKEQHVSIGEKQVVTIGKEQAVTIGTGQSTSVGKEITVTVGKLYKLLSGEKFTGEAKVWQVNVDDKIVLSAPGGFIEINKKGVRIRGMVVDIEGNMINLKRGGPGEGAKCLRQMAKSSTPFVK